MKIRYLVKAMAFLLLVVGAAPAASDRVLEPGARENFFLFGPLGEDSYRRYAPSPPNDPDYVIVKIREAFGARDDGKNDIPRADRQRMWENYQALLDRLELKSSEPVLEQIYDYLRLVSPLAAEQLTEKPSGLGVHLRDIRHFCNALFCTPEGRSRFDRVLTDREALILAEVTAPLHDSLKYLGTFKAQVVPDHEIITAELVRRTFVGRTARLRGEATTLSREDVDLISSVIGDHENIEKEAGRTLWLAADDVRQRAKALFFIADVLTGAIIEDPPGSGVFRFDPDQLDRRFVDLYFRHIDPVKGKIFRPEWGLAAMRDLGTTLDSLVKNHGLVLSSERDGGSAKSILKSAARAGIERALAADAERWRVARDAGRDQPDQFLSKEQLERIRRVQDQIP